MDDSIIAKRGPYEHHEETGHKLVGYAAVHGVVAAARKCQNCTLLARVSFSIIATAKLSYSYCESYCRRKNVFVNVMSSNHCMRKTQTELSHILL